jgi:hypothetical protein
VGSSDMDLADILRYNVICCMFGRVVLVTIIVLRNRSRKSRSGRTQQDRFVLRTETAL